MLAPVACDVDETTMSAPCPSGHFRRSVTETPVGSRRVERLAHGLPNQTLGHGGQTVGGDRSEAGEGRVRHESGEARRAEAAVVDGAADGMVKLFEMIGLRCSQW